MSLTIYNVLKILKLLPYYTIISINYLKRGAMSSGNIIGVSEIVKKLKDQISKVSKVDYSLLITGESGCGKELVARSVHSSGIRSANSFIPVNSASIPPNLLESELFGYVKGAFTDAVNDRKGLIEEADGGSLFLDEIGELPMELQSKLLRVLQEKEIKRVGENRYRKIDLRLISATNRDIERMIDSGKFREDLFYRIQDLIIEVPPLRDRVEDIPVLIEYFTKKHGFKFNSEDISILTNYSIRKEWKGNIRELESFLKRAYTYYPDYMSPSKKKDNFTEGLIEKRHKFEYYIIKKVLLRNNWNKTRSAEELKISRTYLFTLLKKHQLTDPVNK